MSEGTERLWQVCLKVMWQGIGPETEQYIAPDFRYTDPLVGAGDARTYVNAIAAMSALFDDWEMRDAGHAWHGREVFARVPFSCRVVATGRRWEVDAVMRFVFNDEDMLTEMAGYYDAIPLLESMPEHGDAVTRAKRQFQA